MSTKRKVTINIDDFTVGDFIDFEDVAGVPLTDAMKAAAPKPVFDGNGEPVLGEDGEQVEEAGSVPMKVMLALLWLAGRQSGDAKTLEEVRGWKIAELDIEFIGGDEADPQTADDA